MMKSDAKILNSSTCLHDEYLTTLFRSILGATVKFHTKYEMRQRKVQIHIWRLAVCYISGLILLVSEITRRDVFVCCNSKYLKICQNLLPAHLGLSESLKEYLSTKDLATGDAWGCAVFL